ncbi:cyclic GMP-AMP synthase DncV-like nucleotidyltransferase [Spirosoma aerophilum]
MADCQNLFRTYLSKISIDSDKEKKMKISRDKLRDKIRDWFKENQPNYKPYFYVQGSTKMKSVIRTKDDICDLDDGVYFFQTPDHKPETLQDWVRQAVDGYTSKPAQHRKKCIRTIFAGDYEIDHPVYYKDADSDEYQIAIKGEGWRDDDPKGMISWFIKKKKQDARIVNAVMYLKTWCDFKRHKMPSGLTMTILASNALDKIVLNDRDDITLKDILNEIKKTLDAEFECTVPVEPGDDLFEDYDQARKDNFMTALKEFLDDADKALKEDNQLKASKLWQKHLGDRFPDGEDKKQDSVLKTTVAAGAARSNPWSNG